MRLRFSPFVIGDWVRGERFYGRRLQLGEILSGHRKSTWLLGTRRSGKTSMLKQLEYLTQNDPELRFFPVFWDLQGAENRKGLEESWMDALLDAEERLEKHDIAVDDFQGDSLFNTIGRLRRLLAARGSRLLVLCDEAEELIRLQRSDPKLLRRLRRSLQSSQDIHCVLASSIRLWALSESSEDTSPFLYGFAPPIYLERLSDKSARSLVRQQQMPSRLRPKLADEVVDHIIRRCDNQAYLLQMVAKRTVECGELEEACHRVSSDQMVRRFFKTDVDMLSELDRRILSILADQSTATSRSVSDHLGNDELEGELQDSLYRLESLHFMHRNEERSFVLSNYFFVRWIEAFKKSGDFSTTMGLERKMQPASAPSDHASAPSVHEGGLIDKRYRVLELLSEGAQGIVYRTQDELLGVQVVVKLLKTELVASEKALERVRHEILLSRDLGHENILRTYHLGTWEGRTYLTMKWVDGPTLKDVIREQAPLEVETILEIGARLASALAAAHHHQVLHRDLKPDNVLMEQGHTPLIADFGLARMIDEPGWTRPDSFVGTPRYAAPEQARQETLDKRSDIYSLGLILYEMTTGQTPFSAPTLVALLVKHSREPAPDPRLSRPELPEDLARIILRCLEKRPADRFATAADLERALTKLRMKS